MKNLLPVCITPFTNDGKLYRKGVEDLYAYLASFGVKTLFVNGSYAAFAIMPREMRIELGYMSTEIAHQHGLESIFNVASSSVDETEILLAGLKDSKIEAYSTLLPFYYSNAGIYGFEEIKKYLQHLVSKTATPFYFYNNSKTTGVDISAKQLNILAEETGIAGIKDSNDNMKKLIEVSELPIGKSDAKVDYIPGTTACMLTAGTLGIRRCMSGLFLTFPKIVTKLYHASRGGDSKEAMNLYKKVMMARDVMGHYGARPVSAYYVLKFRGIDVGEPRFPWPRFDKSTQEELLSDLKRLDVL